MISMNIRPPRLSEARKLAALPAVKARMRKSERRNIGWVTLVSMIPKTTRMAMPPKISLKHHGAGPAHGVPAVGQQAVGDADQDEDQPDGEGDVAEPVDVGRGAHAAVLELHGRPTRCRATPKGTEIKKTRCHSTGRQQAAEHEPDERAGDGGDVVDPEAESALVGRGRHR